MNAMTKIIIFAKAPLAGFAKTRLIPKLGAEGAAKLAQQMLSTTLRHATKAGADQVELCMTPNPNHSAWKEGTIPDGVVCSAQGEGDLGERMARAASRSLQEGYWVLLIGTDCVEMSAALLQEAITQLQRVDAVIYTTVDGGYALLGFKCFHPYLFSAIHWGSASVGHETIKRIQGVGWSLFQGTMLHDVDEPEDLIYLVPLDEHNPFRS